MDSRAKDPEDILPAWPRRGRPLPLGLTASYVGCNPSPCWRNSFSSYNPFGAVLVPDLYEGRACKDKNTLGYMGWHDEHGVLNCPRNQPFRMVPFIACGDSECGC